VDDIKDLSYKKNASDVTARMLTTNPPFEFRVHADAAERASGPGDLLGSEDVDAFGDFELDGDGLATGVMDSDGMEDGEAEEEAETVGVGDAEREGVVVGAAARPAHSESGDSEGATGRGEEDARMGRAAAVPRGRAWVTRNVWFV
jgi:hypothetical protein